MDPISPLRTATDDQVSPVRHAGPSGGKADTNDGMFRRGTEGVPRSTVSPDDETSGDGIDGDLPDVRPNGKERASQPWPMLSRDATVVMGDGHQPVDPAPTPIIASSSPSQQRAPGPGFASSSSQIPNLTDSSQWNPTPADPYPWPETNPGSPASPHMSNSDAFIESSPSHPHMIGKSAWGAQDWFSASPRLGQSMSQGLPDDGPIYGGGLSPTPSSPLSFHGVSYSVFDRDDLVPASFPRDFASEVGFGDALSTSPDRNTLLTSYFRGFTHHSDYAGDLISSTRTHQPQQHFEYGFGETGFEFPGTQASSPHAPGGHLERIDEIDLNAITLQPSYDTNPGGALPPYNDDSLDLVPGSGWVPPHFIDPMDPIAAATAAGMSPHSTPPATPSTSFMSKSFRRERTIRARLRNASPGLYEAAGYKSRQTSREVAGAISPLWAEASDRPPFVGPVGSPRERGADRNERSFRRGAGSTTDSDDAFFQSDSSHRSVIMFLLKPLTQILSPF